MNERALIALLVLVALVVGTNLVLFGIVRSIAGGDHDWIKGLMKSFTQPLRGSQGPLDELRQRVAELPPREESSEKDDSTKTAASSEGH